MVDTTANTPATGGVGQVEQGAQQGPDTGPTLVISAALATGLVGNYQEAVDSGGPLDDEFDEYERAALLATFGRAADAIEAAQRDPDVFACPDDRVGAIMLTVLEELAPEFGGVALSPVDGQEAKFDPHDLVGWATAAWPQFKQWAGIDRAKFPPPQSEPVYIQNHARIAVLGDWGTGLYGSKYCAKSIEDSEPAPHVLLHLGDVYYTGTEKQIHERFLKHWPRMENAVSRACNSNHEMLSGGKPYRDVILPKFGQTSSMWWLQNDFFDLIGLDSGYDNGDLSAEQADWFEMIVRKAREQSPARRTIAFSHHMPWRTDRHELVDQPLESIRPLLEEGLLDGWYFGHEHLCALFERHSAWGMFGACVGHSGYPYWAVSTEGRTMVRENADGSSWWRHDATVHVPASFLLSGKNSYVKGHADRYGPNGYAMLALGEGDWVETVHEPLGAELSRRRLDPGDRHGRTWTIGDLA